MPTTYYVSAATGSDSNGGLSPDQPLASIAGVEQLRLGPGDSVLLARGTSYAEEFALKFSGSAGKPITIGAYGEGEAPIIHGGSVGIHGSKTSDIVIENIAIRDTTGNAIYAGRASDWTINAVTVTGTGTPEKSGAISLQNSTNITIKDSTISQVTGDGIWISGGKGVTLEGNTVMTVQGHNSDNIQIGDSSDIIVRANRLDMSGGTDSSKGNLVINKSQDILVEGNTLIGGGFGASINSHGVKIIGNEIYGQKGYDWSFGIGLGEKWDVGDYLIQTNKIHDVNYGVSITGFGKEPVARLDIRVLDNIFDNIAKAALKVDRPASGEFLRNQVDAGSQPVDMSPNAQKAGSFVLGQAADPTEGTSTHVGMARDDAGIAHMLVHLWS